MHAENKAATPPRLPHQGRTQEAKPSIGTDDVSDSGAAGFDGVKTPASPIGDETKPPNSADQATYAVPAEISAGDPLTNPIKNALTVSEPNKEKAKAPNLPMATSIAPRIKAEVTALRKPPQIFPKQLAKDKPVVDQGVSSMHEKIKSRQYPIKTFEVVVGPGDTLYDIVRRAFGTYDKRFLDRVLKSNPEIPVSGKIYPRQVIRIPVEPKQAE
jgi:hypothetical protein